MIKQAVMVLVSGCLAISFTAQAGDANAGKSKSENCALCHGENGKDDTPIAGMAEDNFVKAMKAYQSGERNHKKMAKAAKGLSDADIADLAAYYSSMK